MLPHERVANCNINVDFFLDFFFWKCSKNGELLLKNDDSLLKNGRLFCNWRYIAIVDQIKVPDVPAGKYVIRWRWDAE